MKLSKIVTVSIFFFSLIGCINPNDTEANTTPTTSASVINRAQELVSDQMRDPEATRFKSEYTAFTTSFGDTIVCGTLNGKNAMGGYVGYKPYYVRIRNGVIQAFHIVPENDEYKVTLNDIVQVCSEAANGKVMVSN